MRSKRESNQVKAKLTPTQRTELWAWYLAKKALGTFKSKARELGVSPSSISEFVAHRIRKEREQDEKRRRMSDAWEQMNRLPF